MVPPPPGRAGLLLLFCLAVGVAEAAPTPTPATEEPDAELLDFLGSWQDEDGRWVDPFALTGDRASQVPVESTSDHQRATAGVRKPARENPSTPAQDHPHDSLRIHTGP